MAAIADFLSDIITGITLLGFALAMGGLAWSALILRVFGAAGEAGGAPTCRAIKLIGVGALTLGIGQVAEIAANAEVLGASMGRSPFPGIYHIAWYDAAALQAILAFAMAQAAIWLARAPREVKRWGAVGLLGLTVTAAGAWLTHAFSRIEQKSLLMALTDIHMLAGALWVGGVLHLGALRHLIWRQPKLRSLWPVAIKRFSVFGGATVGLAVATAIPLALHYVPSFDGLIGTGYGSMVIAKVLLLGSGLAFAALNFRAGKRWGRTGDGTELMRRVPYYIEAETFVLVTLLLAAASLAHQPPAIDITSEQASLAEVIQVFTPKVPRVTSPAHAELPADPGDPLGLSTQDDRLESEWSEYNHNVSGLVLIALAVLAALSRFEGFRWARHWPLGFVALAIFLLIRSDPETWPLGQVPFLVSLGDAEVLQHRMAILLAAVLGLIEWRARTTEQKSPWYAYLFPVLSLAGGILLLTHSHAAFELKSQYLIQVSHTAMGLFALFLAIGRWLELRLEPPASRWAGLGALVSLLAIGTILTFYREGPVV